ncbi:MAG TPA: DUF134 domain-containing protein [bacterium]|nr:DUF134 domain-containing protein [bacterium]
MSPRPRKPRHCRHRVAGRVFKPRGVPLSQLRQVPLAPDELEALQLCDGEGLSQEEAGARMGVSRGTVQRTVKAARRKIIETLTAGDAALVLCDESAEKQ